MGVWQAYGDSSSYFRTLPRGCISLWTGQLYNPPVDGRQGGDPYRMETDEEYKARQERYQATLDAYRRDKVEPSAPKPVDEVK